MISGRVPRTMATFVDCIAPFSAFLSREQWSVEGIFVDGLSFFLFSCVLLVLSLD